MHEFAPGDIHGNARRRQSSGTPLCKIAANSLQCPFADVSNQPGLLGNGDEVARRDLTSRGVEPTQQGLSARQLERSRIVFGLVVNLNSISSDKRFNERALTAQSYTRS
jgi:hypothetical protein